MQIDAGKYILRKVTAYLGKPVDFSGGFMLWSIPQQVTMLGERYFDIYVLEKIDADDEDGRDAAIVEGGDIPAR